MPTFRNPTTDDVRVVPDELTGRYEDRGWERQPDASTPDLLRGQALDRALEDAGLSKSGSADEKRARLAAHQDGQAAE